MRRRSLLDGGRTTISVSKATQRELSEAARGMNVNVADLTEFALRAVIDGRLDASDVKRMTYDAAVAALQLRMGYTP